MRLLDLLPSAKGIRVLAFLLGFTAANAVAGTVGILEGRVIDKKTRDPLVAVNIQLLGTSMGGVTDPEGYYQINNIRAGAYDVQFSIVGYKTIRVRNVTILADLRTRLDVEMDVSAVEMEAVEVRAIRPLIQKDQPVTAFSIGDVKMEKLPVTSFQDVLSLQPGTTLEGNVRGGKTNEVMYLIDGLPVQDAVAGGLAGDIPKSSIGGMMIYTGGFEAEYGNALSAIINVVTKSGDNEHRFGVRFEKDNWIPSKWDQQVDQYNELEVTARGPVFRDQLYYFSANTARLSNSRWWQEFQNFFPSPVSREFYGISKLDVVLSASMRMSLQGIYSLKRWHDYEFSWRYNLAGLPGRAKNLYRFVASATQTLSNNSSYTISLSRLYHQNRVGIGSKKDLSAEPYQYDFFLRYILEGEKTWWANTQQVVYTLKGDYTSQIDRQHFMKLGFEFNQYDTYSDLVKFEPQTTYFGKTLESAPLLNYSNRYEYFPRTGSAFAQDKIEFSRDGSILSLGVRWDFLDPRAERPLVEFIPTSQKEFEQSVVGTARASFKQQFSPRLAFAMPLSTSSMFYVNFGHYFQYPLFDYLYSGISPAQIRGGTRGVLTGNPDLSPERTIAWEVGYKNAISEFYVGSVTYFKKSTRNQIDSKTLIPFDSKAAGDYGFASYVNNAFADASGLEFVLSRERDERIAGSISYTYMITEGVSEYVDQRVNFAQWGFALKPKPFPLSWDQRHTIKVDVDTKFPGDLQANFIVLYNSPRPYTFYPTRDGFTPSDSTFDFSPNNGRMKSILFVNAKLSRRFEFGDPHQISLVVYADCRNILNAKNVKWIDSNGRIGGELSDPSAYYDPRRIRVGVTVEF